MRRCLEPKRVERINALEELAEHPLNVGEAKDALKQDVTMYAASRVFHITGHESRSAIKKNSF